MDQATPTPRANKPKINTTLSIAVVSIILLVIIIGFFSLRKSSQPTTSLIGGSNKVSLPKPKSSQALNKDFSFALKDANGKQVSKFKYTLTTVEKTDEIIVKGKRNVAVAGRTFLVLTIRIRNDFNKPINIQARDYIRLTVNGKDDKYAADIHNDPVEVQPDSTKETRLAFPINEADKDLALLVGELQGKKETMKLMLK